MGVDERIEVMTEFAENAREQMLTRLVSKDHWGISWRGDYRDTDVLFRLLRAVDHLGYALDQYREGNVGHDELQKRAADVANQAFMTADVERLHNDYPTADAGPSDTAALGRALSRFMALRESIKHG